MKRNILGLIFTTLIILFSCNSKQEESLSYAHVSGDEIAVSEVALAEPPLVKSLDYEPPTVVDQQGELAEKSKTGILGDKSTVNQKKIIKDGNLSVKTSDINTSKKNIDALLEKLNAYYESEDLQNNDETISYDLKIKVPASYFEKLISRIENGKDEIKSKSIQARDVTAEYIDTETRLENKRDYLKRYKELLAKAATVKDILAIEENIRKLQEEIESRERRLKYLNDQVSFSTLELNLYQEKEFKYKPQPQNKFSERVKKSLGNGWTSVVDFVLWIITIWPYIILAIVSFLAIKRIIKKRKARQS